MQRAMMVDRGNVNGNYLEKSQNLALISEPSVDAHLFHLRNQNLAFVIIMMVMVMMLKIDQNKIGDDLDDYSDDGLVMVITMT